MMNTIVITIPWAVVLVVLLLAVASAAFLLAFFLWFRGRRLQAEASRSIDAKPASGGICPRCGMKVQPWFRFCVHCGDPLGEE